MIVTGFQTERTAELTEVLPSFALTGPLAERRAGLPEDLTSTKVRQLHKRQRRGWGEGGGSSHPKRK